MKEKIIAYVKDNRLFVSVIALLMVIFCFFLWMTCGAGNSMEAETSYTDVTALSTSSSKQRDVYKRQTLGSTCRYYRFLWDECSFTVYDCQSSLDFHHYR